MTVGERIGYLCKYHKLRQSDLSSMSGVSQGAISNIISGKKEPQFGTTLAIATALGIHVEDLCSTDDTYVLRHISGLPPIRRGEIPEAQTAAWGRDPESMQIMADITLMPLAVRAEILTGLRHIMNRYI